MSLIGCLGAAFNIAFRHRAGSIQCPRTDYWNQAAVHTSKRKVHTTPRPQILTVSLKLISLSHFTKCFRTSKHWVRRGGTCDLLHSCLTLNPLSYQDITSSKWHLVGLCHGPCPLDLGDFQAQPVGRTPRLSWCHLFLSKECMKRPLSSIAPRSNVSKESNNKTDRHALSPEDAHVDILRSKPQLESLQ